MLLISKIFYRVVSLIVEAETFEDESCNIMSFSNDLSASSLSNGIITFVLEVPVV